MEKEVSIMRQITHILRRPAVLACHLVLVFLLSTQTGITDADAAEAAAQASGPPNILFIIMDDVGIDQMRVFGYGEDNQPRTPNIDTIAHAGVRFRNAWAMPECSPSRVSFFTGRYPLRTGVLNISATRDLANSQASPFEVTTPRVLRSRGYKNGLFGKWHLTEVPGNDQNGNPNPGNPWGTPRLTTWAGISTSVIWRVPHAPSIPPQAAWQVSTQIPVSGHTPVDSSMTRRSAPAISVTGPVAPSVSPMTPRAPSPVGPAWSAAASWSPMPHVRTSSPTGQLQFVQWLLRVAAGHQSGRRQRRGGGRE